MSDQLIAICFIKKWGVQFLISRTVAEVFSDRDSPDFGWYNILQSKANDHITISF